jgi:uncharacterized phage protein gp47/JayE
VSDVLNPTQVYGILPSGFTRMRLPEIRLAIVQDLQDRTGLTFETRPDSIMGQLIDTFAEREATLWELSEAVYHAMYPISSFGVNLDHSVSFSGVRRLFAEKSSVLAIMYGVEGTTIPAGSTVRENITSSVLQIPPGAVITQSKAADVTIAIDTATVGAVYSVKINAVTYSVTAATGEDKFAITARLATALAAAPVFVTTSANTIRMFVIESFSFSFQVLTNVRITQLGTSGTFFAVDYGALELPVGSVTQIVSTATGWTSVNNIVPGYIGRDDETDDELRLRYEKGVFQLGAATLNSIYANLLKNVPGILALKVYENKDNTTDADGRLPHSIEVVSLGGDSQLLANEIFLQKAAGIDTNGSVAVTVNDSQNYAHTIKFNRPTQVYIWVNVVVKQYVKEVYPPTGNTLIKQVIAIDGDLLGINVDVIIQRIVAVVMDNVPGIEILTITIAGTTDPNHVPIAGEYTGNTFPIGPRQLSNFDVARVAVTIAP